ncbi:MAG: 6-pyruvoyl trahydropterin synthase family protein [Flavobacteriales bacterium]
MKKIRISKEFSFETAHALDMHESKCRNIHGHSYKLTVTVLGVVNSDESSPSVGMVMDFTELKKIVNEEVVDKLDHALVLKSDSRFKGIEEHNEKTIYVDYHPTCENLLKEIVSLISKKLPQGIELVYAKMNETARSYSEWILED